MSADAPEEEGCCGKGCILFCLTFILLWIVLSGFSIPIHIYIR